MTGTIIPNLIDISLCEVIGSWTGVPTPTTQDTALFDAKQGTYCLQSYSAGAAIRNARWDFGTGDLKNFTGQFLYFWFAFSKKNYTAGTGNMTIRLTDSTGRNRDWYIFNKTTLPHIGWIGWCINAEYGYDAQDSGFDITQIRYAGWRLDDTILGKVYIYWDAWRFGTGLSIKSGTEGLPAVLEDFYTSETTNAYGVVNKIGGVYFVKGKIGIGSMTIDESTYFKDSNQVIIFEDIKGTPSGVYEIIGQRYNGGIGATKIFFGEDGIGGSIIKATSSMKFKFTMTDSGITELGIHGCTFQNADTISLPDYNANKEVLNCNFIASAEILVGTCTLNGCNFISSIGRAIKISSTNHNITSCNFINCQTAIHHNVGGPTGNHAHFDYNKLMFTGGTYHIENSASSPDYYIDIDRLNGSNPDQAKINNSNGGSTTLLAIGVQLTLTGLIAGSDVRILNAGTTTVLAETDNSGTSFVYSYEYGVYPQVDIIILHLDYEYFRLENYTPGSSNASMPIPLRKDRWYSNP